MSVRITSITILMLLPLGVLTLSFSVKPAQSDATIRSADFLDIGDFMTGTDSSEVSLASIRHSHIPSVKSFFDDGLDTRSMGHFHPSNEANGEWDLQNLKEWEDYACLDDDSVELVVGVSGEQSYCHSKLANVIRDNGGELVNTVSMNGRTAAVVVDVPHEVMSNFVSEVENAGLSRYIEPNMKFKANFQPNDPDWSKQWGPVKIEADYAWDTQVGDPSVLVAVVDSGIDWDHPDLEDNYVALGYDWANNDSDPMDDMGHGTHCAGIIAAVMNNSVGIAGMAQVQIMAEKVLDQWGYGYADWVVNGIVHATNCGADIISMSIGSYGWSELLQDAVEYAHSSGVLLVAAAGNEETSTKLYPAGYEEVIAVTATDSTDLPASFTNFGDWVEVAAPGVDIYSTISSVHDPQKSYPHDFASGTSMAAPHVAGLAALIWSQFPNMTRDQVLGQLQHTADDLGYPGFDVCYGHGRINARRAVEHALLDHDLLISRLETPPYVRLGRRAIINATVFNFGTVDESDITVELLANGSLVDSAIIGTIASFGSVTVNFLWIPTVEGIHNVTAYAVVGSNETVTGNNALSTCIPVRNARIFRVPEDYSTIQAAVDASISGIGDTVMVAAGIYYERLVINKSLAIFGEDRSTTIIDGNGSGRVVHIKMPIAMRSRIYTPHGINFTRFTIRNGFYGLLIDGIRGGNFSENVISDCRGDGVDLSYSRSCTLRDNEINGSRFNFYVTGGLLLHYMHDIDASNTVNGKAIHYLVNEYDRQVTSDAGYVAAINSTNITISNLTITNSGHGVLLAYSTDSTVTNISVKNSLWGIELFESCANTISRNTIQENMVGILLYDHSDYNEISDNTVAGNEALAGLAGLFGIGLSGESSNNIIRGNTISNNTAFFGHGIRLEYSSNNNTICHNSFIDNSVQASLFLSFNNKWDYSYPLGGNFWSDYDQNDACTGPSQNMSGSDGIGDRPYSIDENNKDRYPLINPWKPPIPGDINKDYRVDMLDIALAARAFGAYPGHPRWNLIADTNKDNKADMRDIASIARNFGKTCL